MLYLFVPDFLFSALSGALSAAIASNTELSGLGWMCKFQSFYLVWTMSCVCWLSAVIGYELHYMLWSSFRCIRYQPPTKQRATRNSLVVYTIVVALACWSTFGYPAVYTADSSMQGDLYCLPVSHDTKTILFLCFCFYPLLATIPLVFLTWVVYDVYRHKILPQRGQRRNLSLYFLRLGLMYILLRFPAAAVATFAPMANSWLTWAVGICGHLQVLLSAVLSLRKPDVLLAVQELMTCQRTQEHEQQAFSVNDSKEVCQEAQLSRQPSSRGTLERTVRSSWSFFPGSQKSLVRSGTTNQKSQKSLAKGESSTALDNGDENPNDPPKTDSETDRVQDRFPLFIEEYEDVPKQSDLHYQFDDELDETNIIAYHIEEENDEEDLPVCPFEDP